MMKNHLPALARAALSVSALLPIACTASPPPRIAPRPPITDTLVFGDADSEQAHALTAQNSDTIIGGLGESARRLLPRETTDPRQNWEGGRVAFTLQVDPAKRNYFTVRLWGSDVNPDRLVLFCEGKQIGYHHIGDVDLLDFGSDSDSPGYNGRFFYNTTPLPLSMTQGKTELHFEIRSIGRIWSYGATFAQYQKPMTVATRGIYRVYTSTGDGCFVPPAGERQGAAPADPPRRQEPGPEVLEAVKARVNHEVNGLLSGSRPLDQMQMQFLARAYDAAWTPAYRNPRALTRIVDGLDAVYAAYYQNPRLAESDPATPNADWFGLGPSGDVLRMLVAPLRPRLDESIDDGNGGRVTRRAAYAGMLVACRDWHRRHRRLYTNQTMINDLYGIYLANRGIAVTDPAQAMPEAQVKRYLYESLGLGPWRDSDKGGVAADAHDQKTGWGVGPDYWELTDKGLTRELGYVGTYGEVLDWATTIYEATRPAPGLPGDPKIKAQVEKIAHARAPFRYPALDRDGNRAMRLEPIIGWRDAHYPSDVTYAERPTWDASALYLAAATQDPVEVGYVQQMMADGQFFASVQAQMKQNNSLRVTNGLLGIPEQYDWIKAQPARPSRLPMTPGQPDFVFADEQDGVVALKHGSEILYVSLYWRARYAVNFLARVHDITPRFDRIAVVQEETQYDPSRMTYVLPDWIDTEMPGGGKRYPGDLHQAQAGEVLPIAKTPDGIAFKPGNENVHAGRGTFYTLRYGPYLIGMNCTTDRTFTLASPALKGVSTAPDLVGKSLAANAPLRVGPRSTVVLYLGDGGGGSAPGNGGAAAALAQGTARTESPAGKRAPRGK